jgi:hypothetical protein
MSWKPTHRFHLTEQTAEPEQRELIPAPDAIETSCNHVNTSREIQFSLDGRQDRICGACGAVTP